ncbi:MG2 domain-containing protein [Thioclava sp.]|uniref:MG2 domain-containing protein n=1 Tax=Thioclava sp. TaxID=1933450 RepID=UPI003AA8DB77
MRRFGFAALVAAVLMASPAFSQDTAIPARRAVLTQDMDMPGGDIQSIFDTTIEACQRACLSNSACKAFTFNARAGSCFPKSTVGSIVSYRGAYSAVVVNQTATALGLAATRKSDLSFLTSGDLSAAFDQPSSMSLAHIAGDWSVEDLVAAARNAETSKNYDSASNFIGAAVNQTDAADQWVDYARLRLAGHNSRYSSAQNHLAHALAASINGYLRAETAPARVSALVMMADVLQQSGRGKTSIPALRLAQQIQPRDDTAAALDKAIAKFGFHIADQRVESESANPRICATFSDPLAKAGVDYATFVQLPQPGLSVSAQDNQICVGGLQHGSRYAITFRAGLPAASGETLVKPATLTLYVRDRSPSVRFPGRAYVLPRASVAAIPVTTVNAKTLDLTLMQVSDRNILRAIQSDYFGQPLSRYQEYNFSTDVAETLWTGKADVEMEVNKDMTTRLPLDTVLSGLPTGIYVLKAAVPGADPYETPAASQWFVISDLGLTTYSGVDGLHVSVRSLGTTAAKAGVKVTLLASANRILGTAVTDTNGNADFAAGLTRGTEGAAPALVMAQDGGTDLGFISLSDPEFDLSDRGVSGNEASPPIDVFLTTDRGAYRAGETVHATALTRDAETTAIAGLPLTAKLTRPDGVEYTRVVADDAGSGGHVFDLPIAGSAPRGPWRLDVYADVKAAPLASQTFLVEDFLPERIDFTLALPETPIHLGDAPDLTIAAKYLFGAVGADLSVEGSVKLSAVDRLDGFPGYRFGKYDAPFSPVVQPLPDGQKTDASGNVTLRAALPEVSDPSRPLQMTATVRVAEGSGRPVERDLTRALTPSAPIIGIKPLFSDVVGENSEAKFDLIAVGPDNKMVAMNVHWVMNRVETRYQWFQTSGDWNWTPMTTRTRVAEGDVSLSATDPVAVSAPVTWGQYEIVAERSDGPYAAASTNFYAGWYAPADASLTPDTLVMSLDKKAYAPGETAMLRIAPRAAGTALISVLSNKLISRQAVEVKAGDNLVPIKVGTDWGAGVYVTVSVLRPMDEAAGRVPARALGLTYASVDPGDKKLSASIVTAPEAEPRGPMDIAVKVDGAKAGETVYATIAAVDVGILNLTAFTPPDPDGHYFGQRKLGVSIRDVYGRLIDGLNGNMGAVRSGGDAAANIAMKSPPPTEKLVAFFSGVVTVGEDGLAHAQFSLPSFNGTVRVMAVVWSKTGVGQASTDVLVRDPVVVSASVPRFMAPGDQSRLLLEIIHAKGPAGHMGLAVTSAGLTLGAVPEGFDLAEGGKKTLSIPITALNAGLQTIDVVLSTPDGKQLSKQLSLPVQMNDPAISRTTRFDLAAGQSFIFDANVFDGLQKGTGTASIAVGPIARFDAPGLLEALDRYPYGCTEQLTSKAMPLLYLQDVASAMDLGTRGDLHNRVAEAITEVLTNQSASGAFGLWGPSSGDLWLDAYVTDFLSRARAQGFAVPDQAFRAALDNLRNQINTAQDFDTGGGPYAYALMVLAREGAAAIGDLRYYADVKASAFDTPIASAQLGAALAAYGDQTRADAMFRQAARQMAALPTKDGAQILRADYGTNRRDAAAVLALVTEAGSKAINQTQLTDRIAQQSGVDAVSTQEAMWMLLATHALIDRVGAQGFTINGAAVTGPMVRMVQDQTAGNAALDIHNGSDKSAALTVTTYGVPVVPEPAGGTGYAIQRSYFTMEGEPAKIDTVKTGTRLVTVLDVTPFGNGEARLMVSDPLPAGFEIDNPNLMASGDVGGFDWLDSASAMEVAHSEFRQDRFLTAIDRYNNKPFKLAYIVRAISPGTFHHPAASVEDMYRPDIRAHGDTGTVTITR